MPALNPEIFEWARKAAGLSLDEAAHAIDLKEAYGVSGADRLAALEAGKEEPSRPLLLRMAKAYRRSLLVFYLERPPKTGDRGKDFRTLPGGEPPLYNPVLDALIRDIRGRQSIIRSLLEDAEAEKLPFIGSATMEVPVAGLAERIVRQIDFDLTRFRQQNSAEDAFSYLRFRVEDTGIFVLLLGNLGTHHTNIPVDTFRGFAMADEIAPIAIVNDNDARSAWSFTLLHEVAHLWLGDTGVSGWATELAVEQYCSDVAAEILLPPRELEEFAQIGRVPFDQLVEAIGRFAGKRKISRAMVAYRVFRMGAINLKKWSDLKERFRRDWLERKEREALKQANKEGGPSYYVVRRHRIGKALLDLAERSLGEGLLTYTKGRPAPRGTRKKCRAAFVGRAASSWGRIVLYLLDANILITAANTYYPISRVPEFWSWVQHQAAAGHVKIPIEMYEEVLEGRKEDDELLDWVKSDDNRAALVLDEISDPELVRRVVAQGYANDLTDDEVEKIGRDPFLIAYAFGNVERCIVTTEVSKPKKQRHNRHVPDVCESLKVLWCGP